MSEYRGILVVEDALETLQLLTGLLEERGHVVRPANGAELAWRSALAQPPELFLLDIHLPTLSGIDLCRQLKARPQLQMIPVIFVSGDSAVEDKLRAFQAGGVDYIAKPFDPLEISIRVEGQLRLFRLERERELERHALQQAQARLRALVDATEEAMFLLDRQQRVVTMNRVAAARFQRQPVELEGRSMRELLPPELRASRDAHYQRVLNTGEPLHVQDERDGRILQNRLYPVKDSEGRVTAVAMFSADVSQKLTLERLDALSATIDQKLLSAVPLPELLAAICQQVADIFRLELAWIAQAQADGVLTVVCHGGPNPLILEAISRLAPSWRDTALGMRLHDAVRRGDMTPQLESQESPSPAGWHEEASRFGVHAVLGIPLIQHASYRGVLLLASGQVRHFQDAVLRQRLEALAGRICLAMDRAHDQEQLRLLSTALTTADNSVFITQESGQLMWANLAFTRLTGYTAEELLGRPPGRLLSDREPDRSLPTWEDLGPEEHWNGELQLQRKDGSRLDARLTVTPVHDPVGRLTHRVFILEDITQEKAAEARIHHLAHYDSLTDLPNRALFMDRLRQAVALARRHQHRVALLFLDVDGLKAVNDHAGHAAGDQLLREVARRLRGCMRESDTVARLSGDEFVVLIQANATTEGVAELSRRLMQVLHMPYLLAGEETRGGASLGVAWFPDDATDEECLLKQADAAMYQVKRTRKRRTLP